MCAACYSDPDLSCVVLKRGRTLVTDEMGWAYDRELANGGYVREAPMRSCERSRSRRMGATLGDDQQTWKRRRRRYVQRRIETRKNGVHGKAHEIGADVIARI